MTRIDEQPALDFALPSGWMGDVQGCVLDMDGVLYRGDTLIPEVPAFLDALRRAGIPYSMATNNSTNTPGQYVKKLSAMGIDVPATSIVTSGVATATYLRSRFPAGTTVYIVGMAALRDAVLEDDYFTPAERDAEIVVSGANFELRYEMLKTACLAIRAGATYIATNADKTFPSEDGLIPGSGAIVAALSAATGIDPLVVGKPNPELVQSCVDIMGAAANRTLMIGDRLDTDILAGQRAGTRTVLVLTGVSDRAEVVESGIVPDVIIDTLDPLTDQLNLIAAGSSR
ncbi:MAG TPA: HAD-IIA family hydrolase [Thermomicrobiales bacterium]|nr:HAD-IIA family hydrolase [Thermomicrobiales bacterium]